LRNKLKIRGIRQMRHKGVVVEVKDRNDVELIKQADLKRIGLRPDEPNKLNPSLIIYDVESEYKVDELKEDFIYKNFDNVDERQFETLRKEIHY